MVTMYRISTTYQSITVFFSYDDNSLSVVDLYLSLAYIYQVLRLTTYPDSRLLASDRNDVGPSIAVIAAPYCLGLPSTTMSDCHLHG